jgi:hypothetical protein
MITGIAMPAYAPAREERCIAWSSKEKLQLTLRIDARVWARSGEK